MNDLPDPIRVCCDGLCHQGRQCPASEDPGAHPATLGDNVAFYGILALCVVAIIGGCVLGLS